MSDKKKIEDLIHELRRSDCLAVDAGEVLEKAQIAPFETPNHDYDHGGESIDISGDFDVADGAGAGD